MKKRIWSILLLLSNLTAFPQWQTHGPYGGPINAALYTKSNEAFVGTINGVFKSADEGQTWLAANTGIERSNVGALATDGDIIFAAVSGEGIYAYNGTTWTPRNNGLGSLSVISLYYSGSGLFAGTSDGVYFSSNHGISWTLANAGIPSTYPIYSWAQVGNKVFGGTYQQGLYSTVNNGGNWTSVGGGFPANTYVYALLAITNTVYAGTSEGVYRSTDGGINWQSANTGFPPNMWAWSFCSKAGSVYAGTYSEGIFVSQNGGNNWSQMNNGLPDLPFPTGLPHNYPPVYALAAGTSALFAATADGLYLSGNSSSWTESDQGIIGNNVTAISSDGTHVLSGTDRNGIYISADNGQTWSRSNQGLNSYNVVATAANNGWLFASVYNGKVFRSNDNGATWNSASAGLPAPAAAFRGDNHRMVIMTMGLQYTPRAIFQSPDNGVTWTQIPTSGFIGLINSIGLLGQKIYAGTARHVYVSSDNGSSWQAIPGALPPAAVTAILPLDTFVFAGIDGGGIYRYAAGGSWTPMNAGLSNKSIRDITIRNGVLYAATWGGGVFMSNDMGASWNELNAGLGDKYVNQLAADANLLYAAADAGAYSYSFSSTGISQAHVSGLRIFPNPSSGIIYIDDPQPEKLSWVVYNTSGEAILQNGNTGKEGNSFIDLRSISKGVYFIRLQGEKSSVMKKIVVQ